MKINPFIRTPFNYDVDEASRETAVSDPGISLTIQSQAEECDLNVLMKRFGVTGHFPENPRVPQYGDFTGISDFRSAIEAVRAAEAGFMEFPAELRAQFNNDPQLMLEFVGNDANYEAARKLGLLRPEPPASVASPEPPGAAGAAIAPTPPEV